MFTVPGTLSSPGWRRPRAATGCWVRAPPRGGSRARGRSSRGRRGPRRRRRCGRALRGKVSDEEGLRLQREEKVLTPFKPSADAKSALWHRLPASRHQGRIHLRPRSHPSMHFYGPTCSPTNFSVIELRINGSLAYYSCPRRKGDIRVIKTAEAAVVASSNQISLETYCYEC